MTTAAGSRPPRRTSPTQSTSPSDAGSWREVGLHFHEIDAEEAERLGMGGLLAVGRAGSSPPRLLVLEHRGSRSPPRCGETAARSCSSGKAVTFDTGGVSLKPTAP